MSLRNWIIGAALLFPMAAVAEEPPALRRDDSLLARAIKNQAERYQLEQEKSLLELRSQVEAMRAKAPAAALDSSGNRPGVEQIWADRALVRFNPSQRQWVGIGELIPGYGKVESILEDGLLVRGANGQTHIGMVASPIQSLGR